MAQKNITSFFSNNNKRKSQSQINAPTKKKQQSTVTVNVYPSRAITPEREVPSVNPEVPSSSLPSVSASASASSTTETSELLVTASKTFRGNNSPIPSHGLNDVSPTQIFLKKFPKTRFGQKLRSFNTAWYKGKRWLEYSVATDGAYCFPCRVFGVNPSTPKFCIEGFNNWQHALDGWNELEDTEKHPEKKKALKGFAKHVISGSHKKNMEAWRSKEQRDRSGTTIESTVQKIDNDHKI